MFLDATFPKLRRSRPPVSRHDRHPAITPSREPAHGGAFPRPVRRHVPMLPVLRASNAPVFVKRDDRKYGCLYVGGQGNGKSSAMMRAFLNDCYDPSAAVILMDPKSEMSRIAVKLVPPDCGKKVWYLDLGRPRFGMNPLAMFNDGPLAMEATAVAENIVASLSDVHEGQVFQSSRRFLMHAALGAIAIAAQKQRPAYIDDLYALLLPEGKESRTLAHAAASGLTDFDQTAAWFGAELPAMLSLAASATVQKADPAINKVQSLQSVPPVRRFLGQHPHQLPLREIIERRDILIVDANMASIGVENAVTCMMFLLRMLYAQLQRQVQWPEDRRPRVALHLDEAHYVAGHGGKVVQELAAVGRAAGLDMSFGLQFFGQLGAGSEQYADTIRSAVINLFQSRFLFRMGDADDAEMATRIAQSVYMSMIRDDPDSRARMGVTPEVLLNLPRFHTLASWIVDGARVPRFIGRTYPLPSNLADTWERHHIARLDQTFGPYPESMLDSSDVNQDTVERQRPKVSATSNGNGRHPVADESESAPSAVAEELLNGDTAPTMPTGRPATNDDTALNSPPDTTAAAGGQSTLDEQVVARDPEIQPDRLVDTPIGDRPEWAHSDVLDIVGQMPPGQAKLFADDDKNSKPSEALADIAFLSRINHVGKWESIDHAITERARLQAQHDQVKAELEASGEEVAKDDPRLPRVPAALRKEAVTVHDLSVDELAIISMLDRVGMTVPKQLGRYAMPDKSEVSRRRILGRMFKRGLVQRAEVGIRDQRDYRGGLPFVYALTALGFKLGRQKVLEEGRDGRGARTVIPANRGDVFRAPEGKGFKLPHDLKAISWMLELRDLLGEKVVTGNWSTPRSPDCKFSVPHTGAGRQRQRIEAGNIPLADSRLAVVDLPLDEKDEFIAPFNAIEPDVRMELRVDGKPIDLLVEYNNLREAKENKSKFENYDAFLTGWCLAHGRVSAAKGTGRRPVVVVVCADAKTMLEMAAVADKTMRARLGVKGSPAASWFYPAREHLFFVIEEDLYHGRLRAFALPSRPPALRATLTGDDHLTVSCVALLPEELKLAARKPRRVTSRRATLEADVLGDGGFDEFDGDGEVDEAPLNEVGVENVAPASTEVAEDPADLPDSDGDLVDERQVEPDGIVDLDEAIEREAEDAGATNADLPPA